MEQIHQHWPALPAISAVHLEQQLKKIGPHNTSKYEYLQQTSTNTFITTVSRKVKSILNYKRVAYSHSQVLIPELVAWERGWIKMGGY